MNSTMERAYATATPEDSRVEGTLDHLSDDWGHLPADVKSHILTFVRHPVASLAPRNSRWVHFELCEQWDQRMDLVEQDDLTDLTEDELDGLERQSRQIHEWQDRLNLSLIHI